MKVGILIACRMKSQRLPQKALRLIVGKPVIDHLIERVKTARKVQEVVLCTSTHPDDAVLEEVARRNDIQFFRGSEEDVLGRFIAAAEAFHLDYVVRVTGDNPLTDPEHIDKLIESHLQTGADFSKVEQLPLGTNCEVISLSTLRKAHELAADPNLSEYMTAYLKQPKYFKINLLDVEPYLNHPEIRLTVDVEEDLQLMEEIYRRLYTPKGRIFSVKDVIKLLVDDEPQLVNLNKKVPERPLPKILIKGDPLVDKPKIVIFTAGLDGHPGVVLDIMERFALYNVVGLIDDNSALHNTTVQGIPVLGGIMESLQKISADVEGYFIASDDTAFREKCFNLMNGRNLKFINVIHPTAIIPKGTTLGQGLFIGPNVVIANNVTIGNGVLIKTDATIDNDNVIKDFVNIGSGGHISGRLQVHKI